jgi:DNA-directed RNA polymerase subunit N (RpoN/RPB10)
MVLADKYKYYLNEVRKRKLAKGLKVDKIIYMTKDHIEKTPEGEVLDELRLFNPCCRCCMMTHVEIL